MSVEWDIFSSSRYLLLTLPFNRNCAIILANIKTNPHKFASSLSLPGLLVPAPCDDDDGLPKQQQPSIELRHTAFPVFEHCKFM